MITNNITDLIGNTPLIKLKYPSEISNCEIFGKAEFLNPGGSIKDRTALGIILDAENDAIDDEDARQKRKVMIFSYFEETTSWIKDYLEIALSSDPELKPYKGKLAVVSGQTQEWDGYSKDEVIDRFTPISMEAKEGTEDKYDLMICTDVLAEGLKKYPHVTILSDEIYSRQIFDNKEMPTFFNYPELRERLIVLEGWSKAYSMTGWRLGWSFWPKELVPHVNKLLINSVSCVNAAAQFAGIAALDGPDDSIDAMMVKFTQRRDLIHKGLNDLPGVECSLPGGAFYAFPNIKGTGMTGGEFCKKAMHEAGVAIVPGTAFGKTCNDYVRFSFAASQDNISQALENVKKMLTK